MIDIKAWLEGCPHIGALTVDKVGPNLGVGLFPQGVEGVSRDILGNARTTRRYILRRRGLRGESWADRVADWVLAAQPPAGCRVSVRGGRLKEPATDGVGTYEVEILVET